MKLNKIPATIVTGFLGSGKTTLLSNVLKQAAGKRIAVIVNEFGELDIDANLLRSCPLDCDDESASLLEGDTPLEGKSGIYELANGCICCTVEEEFLPVMMELVARRDDIDHILIETSGLALPKPLVQAFNWPEIKQFCTVDSVITLIDGPAVAAGRFADDEAQVQALRAADENLDHDPSLQELLDDQLGAADLVIVSKDDLLDESERTRVASIVAKKVPASVKTIYANQGISQEMSLEKLLGIGAASEDQIESVHTHHDHHHTHGESHDHAHDHFDSFVITLGEVNSESLQSSLQHLLENNNIYRVKGFLAINDKPMRQVLQAVGERLQVHFDRLWEDEETRATQLVFIGKDLDKVAITQVLETSMLESA
jgi:cobalamin biosynthesis protein CobW